MCITNEKPKKNIYKKNYIYIYIYIISTNQGRARQPHAGQLLEPGHQALGRRRAAASVSSSLLPACGQQAAWVPAWGAAARHCHAGWLKRMFFGRCARTHRRATVHVSGPSGYDLVCGWHDSWSRVLILKRFKEIFKILQTKGEKKKKGEEETLSMYPICKRALEIYILLGQQ